MIVWFSLAFFFMSQLVALFNRFFFWGNRQELYLFIKKREK
jgi:hypothetical protein